MTPLPVPQELLDFIREGKKFIIAGHKEPDGDCVGSQLALTSFLERLGKKTVPCSSGPFKRSEIAPYEQRFLPRPSEEDRRDARVIVLDCSTAERTGDLGAFLEGLPAAVIDHHAAGDPYGDVVFLDTQAPSVTFMILSLIEAMGAEPTREEAELLLFGLCTDTGFFRHVDEGGGAVFEYAARMVRCGANPKRVFAAINGGKSLDSRILMGLVLSRTESHFEGRLLLSTEKYEDTCLFGLQGRDSDNLYQLLQSVEGTEAIVIIRQETPDNCTVGFRSRDRVDVARIAKKLGGGGHKNAAGLSIPGTIPEIRNLLLKEFGEIL
ncbi:bifunctional oligoribonuclease/PAP phosphatase NrnA [Treponema sp. OttesenSCG-928-L16]|nr:bifunctional oligoribonuclease/PAP phosphatase NrnA [Treponema sp. OttesenSCG-928-L16]